MNVDDNDDDDADVSLLEDLHLWHLLLLMMMTKKKKKKKRPLCIQTMMRSDSSSRWCKLYWTSSCCSRRLLLYLFDEVIRWQISTKTRANDHINEKSWDVASSIWRHDTDELMKAGGAGGNEFNNNSKQPQQLLVAINVQQQRRDQKVESHNNTRTVRWVLPLPSSSFDLDLGAKRVSQGDERHAAAAANKRGSRLSTFTRLWTGRVDDGVT